jgi:hypothetical protein
MREMTEVRGLDLLPNTAPALSTTSDMPKVSAPKAPPKGAVSEEGTKAGDTEALQRQREAEAARARALDERFDRVLSTVEKLSTRTEVKTEPADPRPVRRAYDDPDTYEADLVTWSAKIAAKVTQAEIEKREAAESKAKTEKQQQAEHKKRLDAWSKAKTDAIEKYEDFVEIAESPDVSITPAMAYAIVEENLDSGAGYEIPYHLGKHPEEAAKIAALPQSRQGIAIGRLAERLAAQPVKVTRTTGSKARAPQKSEESMEQYARRRNAEIRARS